MLLLVSCDTDASANGIRPKSYVALHFNCLDLRNIMMPLTTLFAWCQYWCWSCHMTKKSRCTSFWSSWCKEFNGVIDDAIDITWYWCLWQLHHMTKAQCYISFWPSWPKNRMVPLMALLVSCELRPASMVSQDQKSQVAYCFSCLDLMNTMVFWTIPLMEWKWNNYPWL